MNPKTTSEEQRVHTSDIHKAKEILDKLIHAQEVGDIEIFSDCFIHSNKVVNIGTDIDEYWIGWKPFYTYMNKMIKIRRGLKINSRKTNIEISESGDTAWYSQLIDTCIETKSDPFRLEGFRHTGVLQKHDNKWKIVQSHISVALENDKKEFG